jgi:malonyl-CoA O-methyltransferase
MISKARKKLISKPCSFSLADLTLALPFKSGVFDLIVSSLVIEHIPSISFFLANLKKAAAPKARILITGLHPTMQKLGVQARFQKEKNGNHFLPQAYSQKISDYINAAVKTGLKVIKLEEFDVDEALIKATPKVAKYKDWPLLFILELENGS